MNYFESLGCDLATLGIPPVDGHSYVMDYADTKNLVERISHKVQLSRKEVESTDPSDLSTGLAKRALTLAQAGIKFDSTFEHCCDEAEWRLLDGISPYAVSNPAIDSPIVVTHEDEPIGIIKRNKIRTMYGIVDLPEHNIVDGAFHKINNGFPTKVPAADHAWSVALEEESAPTFEPVRLSVFAIPLEERLKLLNYEDPTNIVARVALQGSHDEIIQSIMYAHLNSTPMQAKSVPVLT